MPGSRVPSRPAQLGVSTSSAANEPIEQFKRATTASVRAIAEDGELQVGFGLDEPEFAPDRIGLPSPTIGVAPSELDALRGRSDLLALKARYHDEVVHRRTQPRATVPREVFERAEEARLAALGALQMDGLAHNLDASLESDFHDVPVQLAMPGERSALDAAVGLMIRQVLTNRELPPSAERHIENWREYLQTQVGSQLQSLVDCMDDQALFGTRCKELLVALGLLSEEADQNGDSVEETDAEEEQQDEHSGMEDSVAEDDMSLGEDGDGDPVSMERDLEDDTESIASDLDDDTLQSPVDDLGRIREDADYTAYTTEFDEVVRAEELCDEGELAGLRAMLDKQLLPLKQATTKLAKRLHRKLLAKQTRCWEFNLEEGHLDTGRLAQVVASPMNPLAHKQERESNFRDTVVTLLIDSSGSMRGRSITIAAICGDILGQILERCGVRVEILGFTTSAWRGGRSREQWVNSGKPDHPGRLNDVRHIIFKTADDPWRRCRRSLGLMLREDVLKENIDGEALIWAHTRLVARAEQRKILMVISDGLPVDNSTLLANPSSYLEQHLKYAIHSIESHSPVQLIAIGIGHDVKNHYNRAVTITDADQLGGAMTEQLVELFDEE